MSVDDKNSVNFDLVSSANLQNTLFMYVLTFPEKSKVWNLCHFSHSSIIYVTSFELRLVP